MHSNNNAIRGGARKNFKININLCKHSFLFVYEYQRGGV